MRRTGHFSLTSVMSLLRKLWLEQSCAYTRKNPRNGRRTMNSKSRSICLDREKTLSKWFFLRAPRSVIHVQCTCDRPLTSVTETSKTTQLWFGGEGGDIENAFMHGLWIPFPSVKIFHWLTWLCAKAKHLLITGNVTF